MIENWKTTTAGIAAILAALTDVFTGLSHGTVTPNLVADISGILAGVGLIFAKDTKKGDTK